MVRRSLFGYFDYDYFFSFLLGLQSYNSSGGLIVTFFFILFIEYATLLLLLLWLFLFLFSVFFVFWDMTLNELGLDIRGQLRP